MSFSSPQPKRLDLDECYGIIESQCFSTSSPQDLIGLEVEMLAVKNQESVSLKDLQGSLQKHLPVTPIFDGDVLTALSWNNDPEAGALTFEPGGQLEIATAPQKSLHNVEQKLLDLQSRLDSCLGSEDIRLLQLGANPWETPEQIGLRLTKARYKAMDRHFQSIGPWGRVMMRQTMTIQVCLDYGNSEETLIQRYLASQLLSPFAAAIFANSPFLNQKKMETRGTRTQSWYELDSTRTGFPGLESLIDKPCYQNCVQGYTDAVLDARVVYVKALEHENPEQPLTMREWIQKGYKGVFPTRDDFEAHATLMFPEVRPKGFLELRSVDGQLRSLQMMPAAFFVGLLYDKNNTQKVLDTLLPLFKNHRDHVFQARYGLQDPALAKAAQTFMQWAMEGLERQGLDRYSKMLEMFHRHYTHNRLVPADGLLKSAGNEMLAEKHLREIDAWWQNHIAKGIV